MRFALSTASSCRAFVGLTGELGVREAREERRQRHLAFEAGERRAQAMVDAAAKRHVAAGVADDVEAVGLGDD